VAIRIEGTDTELEVSRVVSFKVDVPMLFHLDQFDDGTWRLTYNSLLIEDIANLIGFKIIREV